MSIQGNIYKLLKPEFRVFDIWLNGRYLTPEERDEVLQFLRKNYSIDLLEAPKIGTYQIHRDTKLNEVIDMADGKSLLADTAREGLVFKSTELHNGQVFSFKSVSKKYLEQEK